MATQALGGHDQSRSNVVGYWFRMLDQRRIRVGVTEWLLQVTGIFSDSDGVWIQIADGHAGGGSILLRVSSCTSVDHALHTLAKQRHTLPPHPIVILATGTDASGECSCTEVPTLH